MGLWIVIAARVGAATPYVRTQIFRNHARPALRWQSDVAKVAAVTAATAGAAAGLLPAVAAIAIAVLSAFNVAAVRLPPRPALVIGVQQTLVGVAVLASTALAS